MSEPTSLWWTNERIEATLSAGYVVSHLKAENQDRLFSLPPWGEGLTSETYMDWILAKAGKLFLILNDIGIPDRIFALVDESYDDSDLPIAAHSVNLLHLSPDGESPALDSKFFHAQWRFLVRGIKEGEHVKYSHNEGVPVEVQRSGLALSNKDGVEKVVLSGAVCRVYLRTQVKIGGAPHFFEEAEVLDEVRSLRRLAHEHLFSVYGSYFVDDSVYVLFSGTYERTLMSFLTDVPQHFRRLPKRQRREILVNWPHCLANGLAWLHSHGLAHGAIRPSNALIDLNHNIFLGQFEALDTLLPPVKVDDVEAYQYAAPERWVRTAAVQEIAPSRTMLPSGGRTARKQSSSNSTKPSLPKLSESKRKSWQSDNSQPSSTASKGTVIRVGLPGSSKRASYASSSSSSSGNGGSGRMRPFTSLKRPIFYAPSITSSNSSDSTTTHAVQTTPNPVGLPSLNSHAIVVQTWQSHQQSNPQSSDIFTLAAIVLDIFTHLCKRKLSAFVHHRGAKNRTAGRGGGVADASFHLDRNLSQVNSWITLLDHDAKKHKDPVFRAVQLMLAVVREMMAKDPEKRPSAFQVERQFNSAIRQLDGIVKLHCLSKTPCPDQADPSRPDGTRTEAEAEVDPLQTSSSVETFLHDSTFEPATPACTEEIPAQTGGPVGTTTSITGPSPAPSIAEFDFGFGNGGGCEWDSSYLESGSSTDQEEYEPEIAHFGEDPVNVKSNLIAASPSAESLVYYGSAAALRGQRPLPIRTTSMSNMNNVNMEKSVP
ncbi:hypothetical protein VTN02DRAFT_4836 [Thermoascus thermophilus]